MGKFEIYKEKQNGTLELVGEFFNHFVDSGKQFMLDFAFNSVCWLSGIDGAGQWYTPRYMGVGSGTATNAGVGGPTGDTPVSVSGTWQGVADNDWHLSAEITGIGGTRAQCTCVRAGNSAFLWATIEDANVDHTIEDPVYITEIGIFIYTGYDNGNDPTSTTATAADRARTMLIRGVSFDTNGDNYIAKRISKQEGESLKIKYIFSDFEG